MRVCPVGLLGVLAFALALGAGLTALARPTPAAASCMMPPPIEDAIAQGEVVFVGTVGVAVNDGRWVTVGVEEIWKGPELPPAVEVRGGPEPGTASSVDRSYTQGTRYLFVVAVEDNRLVDNACSSTTEWSEDLAQFRPEGAHRLVAQDGGEPVEPMSVVLPAFAAIVGGVAVFVLAGLTARRRARRE